MKTAILILAAGSALAAHTTTVRAEPGSSLQERRLAILNGTAPGIVIIGGGRQSKAAAAADAAASAGGAAAPAAVREGGLAARAAETPGPAQPAAPPPWAEPPSGKPLNDARRLDSPTQGISLPVASSAASQAAGKEPAKPGR